MSRALIAMSGGVDSAVAAYLAKEQGHICTGATMKLFGAEDVEDARSVATLLDLPFFVFDFTADFKEKVIGRFIEAYQNGATPNPCIDCNRSMKFEKLLGRAMQLGMDSIVTGHYARVEYDGASGRYVLKKAVDETKDQSYVLYALTQEQLGHTLLPLGGLRKPEVRDIAAKQGFANAKKRDSQDICFVRGGGGGYAGFIRQYTGCEYPKGRFMDTNGNDLGEHQGIIHYTVGQRSGLGLSSAERMYVCSVCARDNTVVVGTSDTLYAKTLTARDIHFIPFSKLDAPLKVRAKIRYKQPEQPATVWQIGTDTIRVEFDGPQRAMTKGQAVVLYEGDVVIGGGTINEIKSPWKS